MKKYIITKPEYEAAVAMAKKNMDKRIDKRLQVIILRYEGKTDEEIGKEVKYHRKRVSQLCSEFKTAGLSEYTSLKYGGNHRNLSEEEEKAFLAAFEEEAKDGQITTISEIAAAYDALTGKERESKSTVYYLLQKHGWRTVKPRTVHPSKASDEVIIFESMSTLTER